MKRWLFLAAVVAAATAFAQAPPNFTPPGNVQFRTDGSLLVSHTRPVYPQLAKQARIQGVVRLEVEIASDGSVARLQAISGHPLLVPAAMDAVKKWRWLPIERGDGTVPTHTTVDITFSLGPPFASPRLVPRLVPGPPQLLLIA